MQDAGYVADVAGGDFLLLGQECARLLLCLPRDARAFFADALARLPRLIRDGRRRALRGTGERGIAGRVRGVGRRAGWVVRIRHSGLLYRDEAVGSDRFNCKPNGGVIVPGEGAEEAPSPSSRGNSRTGADGRA